MMRKSLVSLTAAAGLIAFGASQSLAVTFNFNVLGTTAFATPPGLASTGGNYTELFVPAGLSLVTPTSNLGFGFAIMSNPGSNVADSFSTSTQDMIEFTLEDPGQAGSLTNFEIDGNLAGAVPSNTSSSASFSATGIKNTTLGTSSTSTFTLMGNTYFGFNTSVGTNNVFVGVLQSALLSPASNPAGNSIQGIITAPVGPAVPEPGSMALLLGCAMSGGLFALRRRRA